MSTSTQIANMAVAHLGIGYQIGNLDSENSPEANVMRQFYVPAKRATLRDFPWQFARKRVALSLVSGPTIPPNTPPGALATPEYANHWLYSYAYPADAVHFLKIISWRLNDDRQSRIPYELGMGAQSTLIWTNWENAWGEYTADILDSSRFPPDFELALSLRMAMYGATRLTKGDPFKLGQRAAQLYQDEITKAQATSVNEVQEYQDPESEFIRGRN